MLAYDLASIVEEPLMEYWWKDGIAEYIGYGIVLIIAIIVIVKINNFIEK